MRIKVFSGGQRVERSFQKRQEALTLGMPQYESTELSSPETGTDGATATTHNERQLSPSPPSITDTTIVESALPPSQATATSSDSVTPDSSGFTATTRTTGTTTNTTTRTTPTTTRTTTMTTTITFDSPTTTATDVTAGTDETTTITTTASLVSLEDETTQTPTSTATEIIVAVSGLTVANTIMTTVSRSAARNTSGRQTVSSPTIVYRSGTTSQKLVTVTQTAELQPASSSVGVGAVAGAAGKSHKSTKLSPGAIAGIVVGIVVVTVIITAVLLFRCFRRRRREQRMFEQMASSSSFGGLSHRSMSQPQLPERGSAANLSSMQYLPSHMFIDEYGAHRTHPDPAVFGAAGTSSASGHSPAVGSGQGYPTHAFSTAPPPSPPSPAFMLPPSTERPTPHLSPSGSASLTSPPSPTASSCLEHSPNVIMATLTATGTATAASVSEYDYDYDEARDTLPFPAELANRAFGLTQVYEPSEEMASASEASVSRHTISTTTASGSSTIDSPLPHTPQSCSTFGPIPFHAPSVAQAERDGYGHQALGRLVANVQ